MTPRLFVRKVARADMAEAFTWYEERQLVSVTSSLTL